jgi:hypothetical protein
MLFDSPLGSCSCEVEGRWKGIRTEPGVLWRWKFESSMCAKCRVKAYFSSDFGRGVQPPLMPTSGLARMIHPERVVCASQPSVTLCAWADDSKPDCSVTVVYYGLAERGTSSLCLE